MSYLDLSVNDPSSIGGGTATVSVKPAAPDAHRDLPAGALVALVVVAAITPLILLIAPAVAAQLTTQLNLSPSQIGTFFFVELGAFSLATLPAYAWLHRVDARKVALFAACIFLIGNVATAWLTPDYLELLMLRAFTALGGGTLMVLCMTSAAASLNPDRVYGLWVVGQLITGAIGLFVLPMLFGAFGIRSLYVILSVLAVCILPLTQLFPSLLRQVHRDAKPVAQQTRATGSTLVAGLSVLAALLFYVAIGGVWTFASSAATATGLDAETGGLVLAIASSTGFVGAALASMMGGKVNRTVFIWIGYLGLAAAIIGLSGEPRVTLYIAAILIFKFGWTFVLPFLLAAIAEADSTGRVVPSLTLIIGMGLSLGPLVAGWSIQWTGSTHSLYLGAVALMIGSLVALITMIKLFAARSS